MLPKGQAWEAYYHIASSLQFCGKPINPALTKCLFSSKSEINLV